MTVAAPEGYVQIVQYLGKDQTVTHNLNVQEDSFGDIQLNQYLGYSFIKYKVEIFLQCHKSPKGVSYTYQEVLIP